MRKKYKRSETFAKRVGTSRQAVDAWRSGKSNPTWRHLIKIAEVLKIAPRLLIIPSKRHIFDRWEDHLIDYLEAPPEIKHEKRVTVKDKDGSSDTTKTVERELKLTTKEAIDLTEKLGYFDEVGDKDTDTNAPEPYDPLKDLVEENDKRPGSETDADNPDTKPYDPLRDVAMDD